MAAGVQLSEGAFNGIFLGGCSLIFEGMLRTGGCLS